MSQFIFLDAVFFYFSLQSTHFAQALDNFAQTCVCTSATFRSSGWAPTEPSLIRMYKVIIERVMKYNRHVIIERVMKYNRCVIIDRVMKYYRCVIIGRVMQFNVQRDDREGNAVH